MTYDDLASDSCSSMVPLLKKRSMHQCAEILPIGKSQKMQGDILSFLIATPLFGFLHLL